MVRAWPEIAHTTHTPRHICWGPLPPLPLSLLVCKMAQEHHSRVSEVVSQLFLSGSFARFTFLFRYNVTWNMSRSPELSEPTRTLKMQHSELKI